MKRSLLLFVLVLAGNPLLAKITPAPRYHLRFDRNWKFYLGDDKRAAEVAYDDHNWRTLDLPHDWSAGGEFSKDAPTGGGGGYLPTGIGWYRKTFLLPAAARNKLISIQFDGVYMNSKVWINGHLLGTRPNGYISFYYDLTPYLASGKNVVAVRVDNSEQPNSRWYSGSGIYRHVWIDITNGMHIAHWGTYITTPAVDSTAAAVSIKTSIENTGTVLSNTTLTSVISDESGKEVATATIPVSGSGDWLQLIHLTNPALWSTDHPYLYTLHSIVRSGKKMIDDYTSSFGIRKIVFSNTDGFLLNGKRVKMNGVCIHHDGGCVGAAVPVKIWKERLKLLKEMGCNAIRTSHNPVAPEVLDLCDKMGFLVMDEAFDAWETGKVKNDYHLYFDEWWEKDVTDQVHRDRNHPSVVIWSAGNEIPDQTKDKGVELIKQLLDTYHKEDPTRPVTTANDDIAADNGSTKLPFLEAEDIVGYNYVNRWHERRELYYAPDHFDHPNWKMIGTESGPVRNVTVYSLGTDQSMVRANYTSGMIEAEQLWEFVDVHDYVIGDFMWTGIDYLGEARWPGKSSYSGQISTINLPKDGYYFYQSQWSDKPVLHLFPHWNWPGREGQVMPVITYTNCDTVELFVNNKSYGIKIREFPHQGHAGGWNKYDRPYVPVTTADLHLSWDVPYEPGTIKAVGRKHGKQIIEEIHTTGKAAALRAYTDGSVLQADGSDVALIHIDVVDGNGSLVPDADNLLNFSVQGEGKLIGADNGDPQDDSSFALNTRKAFNGHAYAVLQSVHQAGNIRFVIKSAGLKDAIINVKTSGPVQDTANFEDLK